MIKEFEIENYKSIKKASIELGRLNIFIGENGCGKSNILEAFGMSSLSNYKSIITSEDIYSKGIRVANTKLTFNSFKKINLEKELLFKIKVDQKEEFELGIIPQDTNTMYSNWIGLDKKINLDINNDLKNKFLLDLEYMKNEYKILNKTLDINNTDYNILLAKLEKLSSYLDEYEKTLFNLTKKNKISNLDSFLIYNIETKALRGIIKESLKEPLGINGEGLDVLISNFSKEEFNKLKEHSKFISWLENIIFDDKDLLKLDGHKIGKSTSRLYFQDKFMSKKNNIFSAENANEGILHILFYLSLFISKNTPKFFAIDNIEKSLNPKLCRALTKELAILSKENDKQVLITTHNPAILDGLNLNDDEQRLFVVSRTDEGYTKVERVKLKPNYDENKYKLSEMWMRGLLGGIPNNF